MTGMGFLMALAALVGLVWVIVGAAVGAGIAPGWASLMIVLLFIGAAMFLFMGVIGEYVGKIYDEVRARPTYVIAEEIRSTSDDAPRA
jgi:dolichol-phosphate mannosyltransferase